MPVGVTGCWTLGSAALQGLQFRCEIGKEMSCLQTWYNQDYQLLDLPGKYWRGREICMFSMLKIHSVNQEAVTRQDFS